MWKKVVLFLLLLSCNPPRDNPYDPRSPNYIGKGNVKGKVINRIGTPIEGVNISTIPVKSITITDSIGLFGMSLEPGDWRLVASKTQYVSETTQVEIKLGETEEVNFMLNGNPEIQYTQVLSIHQHEGFPVGDRYWVDIFAKVQDPDGIQDIASVWVVIECDTITLTKDLSFIPTDRLYFGRIYSDSCPGQRLENLIGMPFMIYTKDTQGSIAISTPFYLPRIIYPIPYPVKPIYGDSVLSSTPIEFIWREIKVRYPIEYTLSVTDPSTGNTVYTLSGIKDTTITINPLPPSEYRWRVEGKDSFGDISRSNRATFVVK